MPFESAGALNASLTILPTVDSGARGGRDIKRSLRDCFSPKSALGSSDAAVSNPSLCCARRIAFETSSCLLRMSASMSRLRAADARRSSRVSVPYPIRPDCANCIASFVYIPFFISGTGWPPSAGCSSPLLSSVQVVPLFETR